MEDDGGQVTQLLKAMRGGRPAGSPGLAAVGVRRVTKGGDLQDVPHELVSEDL
jgi:hypothetical protein